MTTKFLFMCPHSAGKSLAAATYFRAAAGRLGLDVAIDVAGPDPDHENMTNVVAALEGQGFTIGWNPRLVQAADVQAADRVVSVGCDPDSIPATADDTVDFWDVPMISADLQASLQAIYTNVEGLAAELAHGAG
jgi:protein-tyrosine-phosphatase